MHKLIRTLAQFVTGLPERWRRRTSGSYRPEIDGLRFFAIALVVAGHAVERVDRLFHGTRGPLDRLLILLFSEPGNGVFLFFAISGFIIASQYLKEGSGGLSLPYLRTYFQRRVLRIEPPYILVVVVTYLGLKLTGFAPSDSRLFQMPPKSLTASLWASLLYCHGWVFGTYPRTFPAGWSLEIEVQFYILAPLLFVLFFGLRSTRSRAAVGSVLMLVSIAAAAMIRDESKFPIGAAPHLYFTLARFFPYFWLGILVVAFKEKIRALLPAWAATGAGVLGLLALGCAAVISHEYRLPQIANSLMKTTAIGLMFVSALTEGCAFRRFISRPWISLIGGACYSIYLTHLPVVEAVTHAVFAMLRPRWFAPSLTLVFLVELPAVLAVALLFYGFVERTFMIPDWPRLAWSKLTAAQGEGRTSPAAAQTLSPESSTTAG